MADAVNICVYVAAREKTCEYLPPDELISLFCAEQRELTTLQRSSASAIWDIWAAEDADELADFLMEVARERGISPLPNHPIHDQCFYLDAHMRRQLCTERGVRGWRFLQREGDAIFIPAGCPHQVLNVHSSIKVAEDFVSPEHVSRCTELTSQFRILPAGHGRFEDVLGIKGILMHAVSHSVSVLGTELTQQPNMHSSPPSQPHAARRMTQCDTLKPAGEGQLSDSSLAAGVSRKRVLDGGHGGGRAATGSESCATWRRAS